jgi:hypothetical protein
MKGRCYMSDEYDDDDNISLDDVIEDEGYGENSDNMDWSDNLDDMDSGEWDSQYGGLDDEIREEEIDPWDLN